MIKSQILITFSRITMILMLCFIFLVGCQKQDDRPDATITSLPLTQSTKIPEKETILIVTGEYAPYTTQGQDNMGFLTEVMEAVLKESGIEYEIKFYPWARCLEMVQSGEAWASFPYGYSDTKDLIYDFSSTIFSSRHKFYYLAENEKIGQEVMAFSEISDFKEFTFGGANGYWYGNQEEFEKCEVKVEWANDTDALVKMLNSGRIDFFIEDELVCDEAIDRLFPEEKDNFLKLPIAAKFQDYFMLISKDYPKTDVLTEQFNKAINKLKENGEIDKILDKNEIKY